MASPPRRMFGSVQISIAVHLVVLLLLLIIPLVATDSLPPVPGMSVPAYVRTVPLPPPPAPAAHTTTRTPSPAREPAPGAPTFAPNQISPDAPSPVIPLAESTGAREGVIGAIGSVVTADVPPPPRPPEPQRPSGPVRVADLPRPPTKIVDIRPVYPEVARSARVEGTVVIEAVIDTAGRVTNCRVIKSAPLFDQSALDAVSQWRYTPSTYNGRTVAVLITITVHFALQ
jgi:periplasmic protein TonB